MTPAGFPHSDIHGSMLACGSPWLFGAYPVLLRLLAPRHPPYALISLTYIPTVNYEQSASLSLTCLLNVPISTSSLRSFRCALHLTRPYQSYFDRPVWPSASLVFFLSLSTYHLVRLSSINRPPRICLILTNLLFDCHLRQSTYLYLVISYR